ncbi:serine/threonine-protein kinase [Streptomyces sp. NPDC047981]|uniref:serine/threonine-protein kinase n=1 Tax=Streptomyces sp. NPDC047981 TaxID=3154610 RepID=UPI003438A6E2
MGADPDAEPPWMATQYFDAPTLSRRIREEGALEEGAVWRLGRGLAEALRDVHRAGLVHRDLKPSNVLLTDDGPRVVDFGIARVLEAEPRTRTGKILGTVSFMAPEQLSAPREVGPAADVFALGGVLAYAATGRGPFDGDTGTPPIAIAMKIAQDEPDLAGFPAGDGRIVCVSQAAGELLWRSAERRDPNRSLVNEAGSTVEPLVLKGVVFAGTSTGSVFAVAPPSE